MLPSDFALWTAKHAAQAIEAAIAEGPTEKGFLVNQKLIEEHDHWQGGATWVGPNGGDNSELRSQVLANVERQFTPVDVVSEVLDRVINALLKREPDVQFVPTDPEPPEPDSAAGLASAARADQMGRRVSDWWDDARLWKHARQAVRRARWAERGALRLWMPASKLSERGTLPTGLPFEDALALVQVEAPEPDAVLVYTDRNTLGQCAVVAFPDEDGRSLAFEIWYVEGEDAVVRVLLKSGEQTYRIPGMGRLPVVEMVAPILVTEPVRRQQHRLNLIESVFVRVVETGGFPERYTTNAAPSGVWSTSPPSDNPVAETLDVDGVTYYLHAMPRTLGAAITTDLAGLTTTDMDGKQTLATPGVVFKEPTDPDYLIRAARHARYTLLESCHQKHVALSERGEASGLAYEQARADFEDDLFATKEPLEAMVRNVLEAAIAFAESMSNESGFLDAYRCVVNLHIMTGPISADAKLANAELVAKGLLAIESAMSANGVEDIDAEVALIEQAPLAKVALVKARAEAMKVLTDAGASLAVAAELAGMDAEDVALLVAPQDAAQGVEQ